MKTGSAGGAAEVEDWLGDGDGMAGGGVEGRRSIAASEEDLER